MSRSFRIVAILAIALPCSSPSPRRRKIRPGLTVQRIFGGSEFEPEHVSIRWLADGSGYVTLEPSSRSCRRPRPGPPRPGDRRDATCWFPRRALIPPGGIVAAGDRRLCVLARSIAAARSSPTRKRVWRTNTRGDYWVLDRSQPRAAEARRRCASRLAHARQVRPGRIRRSPTCARTTSTWKTCVDGRITRLTNSSSPDEINGTFDWVYEEEFGLRDGFRWSPDGKSIAYWQLDTAGVREFPLVNNTDSLYPRINPIKYPKVGETERRVPGRRRLRRGRRDALARRARRPAQPLHRLHGMGRQLRRDRPPAIQPAPEHRSRHAGRRPAPASVDSTILTDHDDAWVDLQDEIHWIHDDQEFLWLSERDGWRHIYRVPDASGWTSPRLITPGDFDVIELVAVDQRVGLGLLHRLAQQPDPALSLPRPPRRHGPRARVAGRATGHARLPDLAGRDDGRSTGFRRSTRSRRRPWSACPAMRRFECSPTTRRCRASSRRSRKGGRSSSGSTSATGSPLDGWCMLPPDFDPNAKYPLLVHVYGEPAGQTVARSLGRVATTSGTRCSPRTDTSS